MDFVFLREKEKENYFGPGNITYSSSSNISKKNVILNELVEENNFKYNNININFNIIFF